MIACGRQIAAAQALIGWSQRDLAAAAGLHVNAVGYWETRGNIPHGERNIPIACQRMHKALKSAGVEIFAKPTFGVRFVEKPQI